MLPAVADALLALQQGLDLTEDSADFARQVLVGLYDKGLIRGMQEGVGDGL